jgi:transcriptional regulator with XRE-family HTH domain
MAESAKATFGKRLQAVRKAYGAMIGEKDLSGAVFAAMLDINPVSYRRYERDEVEPVVSTLRTIRERTGVSLDYLIGFDAPGIADMEAFNATCNATAGERIRFVRELAEPDVSRIARLMNVRLSQYLRWESGMEIMPNEKMEEFAHRFSVSIDYLARGLPVGIAPEALDQLLQAHPRLWRLEMPDSTDTATDADSMESEFAEVRRRRSVFRSEVAEQEPHEPPESPTHLTDHTALEASPETDGCSLTGG